MKNILCFLVVAFAAMFLSSCSTDSGSGSNIPRYDTTTKASGRISLSVGANGMQTRTGDTNESRSVAASGNFTITLDSMSLKDISGEQVFVWENQKCEGKADWVEACQRTFNCSGAPVTDRDTIIKAFSSGLTGSQPGTASLNVYPNGAYSLGIRVLYNDAPTTHYFGSHRHCPVALDTVLTSSDPVPFIEYFTPNVDGKPGSLSGAIDYNVPNDHISGTYRGVDTIRFFPTNVAPQFIPIDYYVSWDITLTKKK